MAEKVGKDQIHRRRIDRAEDVEKEEAEILGIEKEENYKKTAFEEDNFEREVLEKMVILEDSVIFALKELRNVSAKYGTLSQDIKIMLKKKRSDFMLSRLQLSIIEKEDRIKVNNNCIALYEKELHVKQSEKRRRESDKIKVTNEREAICKLLDLKGTIGFKLNVEKMHKELKDAIELIQTCEILPFEPNNLPSSTNTLIQLNKVHSRTYARENGEEYKIKGYVRKVDPIQFISDQFLEDVYTFKPQESTEMKVGDEDDYDEIKQKKQHDLLQLVRVNTIFEKEIPALDKALFELNNAIAQLEADIASAKEENCTLESNLDTERNSARRDSGEREELGGEVPIDSYWSGNGSVSVKDGEEETAIDGASSPMYVGQSMMIDND